jgi:peroxiredoxin
MIDLGAKAPDFTLTDQFGRRFTLSWFAGKQHVMLLFYPLDFTPT